MFCDYTHDKIIAMKTVVNRVIKLLVVSDFVLYFSIGLFSPIFAVFVLDKVQGSTLEVVGLATTVHWLARILTTVPLSRFMDVTKGERDEFYFMIFGTLLISIVPLFYLGVTQAWHIYLIQFILGVAGSMATPAWRILFTNHLDHGETGYEWSLEDIAAGVAVAISAYVGAYVASNYGFDIVLYALAVLGILGTIVLLPLYNDTGRLRRVRQFRRRKKGYRHLQKRHARITVHGV